jgi:hypothetical protein
MEAECNSAGRTDLEVYVPYLPNAPDRQAALVSSLLFCFLFASGAISALTSRRDQIILGAVSALAIIRELPKLIEAERRAIRVGLLEIANQDPDVALSTQSALEGALMLDRMENDGARHQSG